MKEKSGYAWWIFGAACLISLVGFGLVINTVGLFYQPVSAAFHVGRTEVALMSTLANMATAVTLLFAGKIMAKLSVKWILTISFAAIGLGLLSLSFAQSMMHFYIVWTLIGIFQPFAIILSIPVLLGVWFEKKLGTVMGIALGISAIGGMIFNPIIGAVITSGGWRAGELAEGLIILIAMVPVSLFVIKDKPTKGQVPYGFDASVHETVDKAVQKGLSLGQSLRTPMLYLIIFAMTALQFVAGFVQHISAHIVNIGLPLTIGATVVSGVMLGAAVGKIAIGYLLDKLNNSLVIAAFTILGILGWGGLLIMHRATLLTASGFVLGLGQGIVLVALPYLIRKQFGQKDYSSILSIANMFGAVASAIAVSVDGAFFDMNKSYSVPLSINIVLYILAGLAVVAAIEFARHWVKGRQALRNAQGVSK